MNVYILNKLIPDEYTLKYKRSVDKLIIFLSSNGNDEHVV